ncbi:Tetratricopeptide repeat-containing protein [Formivibrio citricus]|uniref:Tetratricopeptide repeat-containing protein n=1 Tax=Formivibrio citricus TaxID=83765 RepID=A0A1I5CFS4_9NEIS|nr:tetratricopeptide repeat protein [Formivibrio citricus]SFN85672.1 Tetratricopeptide repeat-containing protein [Formivibrio citricus]
MKRSLLVCMMFSAQQLIAAGTLPENGLRAEMENRWEDAAKIYRQTLEASPARGDLWLRLSDIHSRLKQHDQAAKALEQAVRLNPEDAGLWMKLSRARSMAGDGQGAFAASGEALKLQPDNIEFLHARAELATWVDNRQAATEAYQRISRLAANDAKAQLGLARLDAWSGRTDSAVAGYKAYLKQRPDDKQVWLDLVKTEGWRGNYPDALDELDEYLLRFGEDRSYLEQRARALAWLGKTKPALEIVEKLLGETPQDVDLLTTRAIARHAANRHREALADLQTIKRLRPDTKETADLSRYLLTPQRSSVTLAYNYGKDSDDVRIGRTSLTGEYVLNPETRFLAGGEWQRLRADTGSGLENINGDNDVNYRGAWLGIKRRFSRMAAGDMRVGGASAAGHNQFLTYKVGFDLRPNDEWWVRPEVERDLFAVSPRAASLPVKRDSNRLYTRWTPDSRYTVDGFASYDHFSDSNNRWEVSLAPRRAMWRTQLVNIDLGLSARWFGFQKDLNNGYYDPQNYQRYALTAFTYWKISDNSGASLALSAGAHKDNTMSSFKPGGDAVLEVFHGIYDDWYLRGYVSLLHNSRQGSGGYRGTTAGASLTRRF